MTFKITDVKTKVVLHERVLSPYEPWLIPLLVRNWADEAGALVDTRDENSAGCADIDASLVKSDNNMGTEFDREATRSFFYL